MGENKADINQNAQNVGTPLIFASMYGNFNLVQSLIRNNAKVNATSTTGWSALHWSVSPRGSLEILKYLIKHGAHVNMNTSIGSPLYLCALYGYLKSVKILIYHNANVNIVKQRSGFSPLHEAADSGHFEVCKYLIAHGANVKKKTKNGLSAYDLASANGHILLAEFFSQNHNLE